MGLIKNLKDTLNKTFQAIVSLIEGTSYHSDICRAQLSIRLAVYELDAATLQLKSLWLWLTTPA